MIIVNSSTENFAEVASWGAFYPNFSNIQETHTLQCKGNQDDADDEDEDDGMPHLVMNSHSWCYFG